MSEVQRETELVLAPNEFAFYLDKTKGIVSVVVGPYKHSLSNTDQLVYWDTNEKKFLPIRQGNRAAQTFTVIPEGWYCHLKNPATKRDHPDKGISDLSDANLDVGRKINIAGPDSFALWPGQMVKVVQGHHLRSNQYLVVRVYDVDAFRKGIDEGRTTADIYDGLILSEESDNLTTGQMFIVKGTKVHFYIPPNGVEVVRMTNTRDGAADFVQNAVTLEQLQYCILQDEDGNKEYVRGPAVVFPKPTQWFIEDKTEKGINAKKFKAIELNDNSGIYVKVIKPYKEGDREYLEGEELFITGDEHKIYFPRQEHAIIRYDGKDKHHSVIIPEGEGRYVLDRETGSINTIKGPRMFLPDPRKEVIVRRILTVKQSRLMYPGNKEAEQFNTQLMEISGSNNSKYIPDSAVKLRKVTRAKGGNGLSIQHAMTESSTAGVMFGMPMASAAPPEDFDIVADAIGGYEIDRTTSYTPPRTLTIDSKYDGVVSINIWNGYAIMIVNKTGQRRVIEGPTTVLLDYDESIEPLSLSTGTPKNTDQLLETVYLRTKNNIISDIVECETSDMCTVAFKVVYRVNFEGDSNKWWDVENYVKFLCDHARSKLKNAIRKVSIREFYGDDISIIRDIILGQHTENGRTGLTFEENGMKVTDLEIKWSKLKDDELAKQLDKRARKALANALELEETEADVKKTQELLAYKRRESELKAAYQKAELEINTQLHEEQVTAAISKVKEEALLAIERHSAQMQELTDRLAVVKEELTIEEMRFNDSMSQKVANQRHILESEEARLQQRLKEMEAEAAKAAKISAAIDPQLTAALSAIADRDLAQDLVTALGPLSMFEDEKSTMELLKLKFGGLGLDRVIDKIAKQIKE